MRLGVEVIEPHDVAVLALRVDPESRTATSWGSITVPVYYFLAAVGIFTLGVGTVVYVRRRGVAATAHFYMLCLFWFLAFGFSFTGELNSWDRAFFWMDVAGLLRTNTAASPPST